MSLPNNVFVVQAGTPVVRDLRNRMLDHPISYICSVEAGGTMVIEISNSLLAIDNPSDPSVKWAASGAGTITDAAPQEVVRYAPCNAIRFTCAGANGKVEQKG